MGKGLRSTLEVDTMQNLMHNRRLMFSLLVAIMIAVVIVLIVAYSGGGTGSGGGGGY
jgi:hypothetical protein